MLVLKDSNVGFRLVSKKEDEISKLDLDIILLVENWIGQVILDYLKIVPVCNFVVITHYFEERFEIVYSKKKND